jgi:hypothetical protein
MRALILLLLLPMQIFAQDLAGVWTGVLQTSGKDLPYEIAISDNGGKLTGYSLTIFNIDGVENVGIKVIRLKNSNGNISIEDEKLIYNNYVTTSRRVKLLGEMLLRVHDTVMTLKGNFRTRSLDFREQNSSSYTGIITLQKLNTPRETKLISTLEEMNLLHTLQFDKPVKETVSTEQPVVVSKEVQKEMPDTVVAAAELATRKTEVIQHVFFASDSLVLKMYDHGVIDGDTVSVVLNGKVIAARQGLKGKPIISVIHMTPALGDSLLLVMYAETLGTIPPNTGILIVQDGDNRYEIRFEGTKQKSSAILLTRKRK